MFYLDRLHPHQKMALAWMVKQEMKDMHGMKGGILADVSLLSGHIFCDISPLSHVILLKLKKSTCLQDMGLGKTLTVIALILTNFHDGRPLCKPEIGYRRPPLEVVRGGNKKSGRKGAAYSSTTTPDLSSVNSKIKTDKKTAFNFFDKFKASLLTES
jgi:SWI/SNF-related matrix-associated actin-dependent regulator of chromatin subfamily A3